MARPGQAMAVPRPAPLVGPVVDAARRTVLGRLAALTGGALVVADGRERRRVGASQGPAVEIAVRDPTLYLDMLLGGALGAAEAFGRGKWDTPDLTALIRLLVAEREVLRGLDCGPARLAEPLRRLGYWIRRNTRRQSRRNIAAHYDAGNDFFALFLDPTLSYSSAVFPRPDAGLDEAAEFKLNLVCRKLALEPGEHLLEIGTGWGGLAVHAARQFRCRVTTTTLSRRQHEYATARVRAAGLEDRVTVLGRDYRDLAGRFDKLVSVEMIEAVGPGFLPTYFQACSERLKPGGRMLLQAILMTDRNYAQYRGRADFINTRIFPGGALPSMGAIMAAVSRASDLQLVDLEDIGAHYGRTLAEWRQRFMARLAEARALGYPERFLRLWQYYLCYCEAAFGERAITDVQLVLDKPAARLAPRPA